MFNFEEEKLDAIEISSNDIYYEIGKRLIKSNDKPLDGKYYFNNSKEIHYFKNGLHNRDGNLPAIICEDGSVFYYVNGKQHRLDGPADMYSDGHYDWFINGNYIDEEFIDKWSKENNVPIDWDTWTANDKFLFAIHWSDYNGK